MLHCCVIHAYLCLLDQSVARKKKFHPVALSLSVKDYTLCTTVASAVRELSNEGRGRDAIKHEAQPSALSTSRPRSEFDNCRTARAKVF